MAAGAGAAALVAGLVWLIWPGDGRPDPRQRVYTQGSACLLTPAAGVADKDAAAVWQAMQEASAETRGKVSFLEVDGPQTADNASTYLGTLALGGCDLVLAAGPGPVAALDARASTYPEKRFVAVGDGRSQANVTVVDPDDPGRSAETIRDLVSQALTSGVN